MLEEDEAELKRVEEEGHVVVVRRRLLKMKCLIVSVMSRIWRRTTALFKPTRAATCLVCHRGFGSFGKENGQVDFDKVRKI